MQRENPFYKNSFKDAPAIFERNASIQEIKCLLSFCEYPFSCQLCLNEFITLKLLTFPFAKLISFSDSPSVVLSHFFGKDSRDSFHPENK